MDLFEPVFSVRPTVVLRGRRHTHAIFLTNSHQLLVYLWFWFRQDLFDSSDLHISANTVRLWPNRIMVKWMCCGFQVRNEKSRQYPAVIITIALVHKFFFWSGGFVPFAYQIPRVPARARLSLSLCVCVCVCVLPCCDSWWSTDSTCADCNRQVDRVSVFSLLLICFGFTWILVCYFLLLLPPAFISGCLPRIFGENCYFVSLSQRKSASIFWPQRELRHE